MFKGDVDALLDAAKSASDTVRDHVTVKYGRYVVTRHGLTGPIPLLETDDVVFAIQLALAHRVEEKWSLGIVAA